MISEEITQLLPVVILYNNYLTVFECQYRTSNATMIKKKPSRPFLLSTKYKSSILQFRVQLGQNICASKAYLGQNCLPPFRIRGYYIWNWRFVIFYYYYALSTFHLSCTFDSTGQQRHRMHSSFHFISK